VKRVLIITYYWPPSGGAGVQRWLKFSKYLPEYGWQPVIYTPENPEAPASDDTLFKDISPETEVLKTRIWEPYSWYKKFLGIRKEEKVNAGFIAEREKPKLKEKISVWIRGNFFIPDARKYWIRPSVRFLRNYLKEHPVDVIITTGPPHSMHLIARGLKKYFSIPWIADFRDPWSEIDFYEQLYLTPMADRKHKRQELKVLSGAERVVAVGDIRAKDLEAIGGRPVDVITNGYDDADFALGDVEADEKFTIVHVGALNRDRNHPAFWKVLGELVEEDQAFREALEVRLIGKVDYSVNSNIEQNKLGAYLNKIEYLPHVEIANMLKASRLLYLPINHTPKPNSIIPGKIFEYMASGRPVLGTGPIHGDSAALLKKTGSGKMVDFEDEAGIRQVLSDSFQTYLKPEKNPKEDSLLQYSRKNLCGQLVKIMDQSAEA